MKRTIEEVMNLLEQKRESAINKLKMEQERIKKEWGKGLILTININVEYIKGEIDAYTDVMCLIASSHLLEKDNLEV